jgi:hypothetical protein
MRYVASIALAVGVAAQTVPALAQNGSLTNERAQAAVEQWLAGDGHAGVIGVLEIPAENGARADLNLSGFVWNVPKNDAVTAYVMGPGGGQQVYNGRATAIFIHYTDGRWVLTRVETPIGNFDNLGITAP